MKINQGKIVGNKYFKNVSFNKAVLWKTRELSLRHEVIQTCIKNEVQDLVFEDFRKKESWIFKLNDILKYGTVKTEGQEEQVYFSISMATKEKITT
jgi:hypothetical protein